MSAPTRVSTAEPQGPARTSGRLQALISARFARSVEVPERFFRDNADLLARACLGMARRFERGGRLLVFGGGAQGSDAAHVAVEFNHPVLVGKRALPALALPPDGDAIRVLGREADIAMGIACDDGTLLYHALHEARAIGMQTLALVGTPGGHLQADFTFVVGDSDEMLVQEVHETLYHVLWELVHVFFEHRVVAS